MKRVIVKRFQPFVKNPNQVRARNLLFCHESEFTVAAPVVDGEAIPRPKHAMCADGPSMTLGSPLASPEIAM